MAVVGYFVQSVNYLCSLDNKNRGPLPLFVCCYESIMKNPKPDDHAFQNSKKKWMKIGN